MGPATWGRWKCCYLDRFCLASATIWRWTSRHNSEIRAVCQSIISCALSDVMAPNRASASALACPHSARSIRRRSPIPAGSGRIKSRTSLGVLTTAPRSGVATRRHRAARHRSSWYAQHRSSSSRFRARSSRHHRCGRRRLGDIARDRHMRASRRPLDRRARVGDHAPAVRRSGMRRGHQRRRVSQR